mgnify:CR=1 FL=1
MSNTPFKLYYTATSCGAASFITATAGGIKFDSEIVDLATHKTASGVDFYTINPKGNVPTVVFDDGSILNENVASLTFLADQGVTETKLAPEAGTPARYQYLNALGFITSDLHKSFGTLFGPHSDESKAAAIKVAEKKAQVLYDVLLDGGKKKYLVGDSITAADVYAYIVLSWSPWIGVTLPEDTKNYFEFIKSNDVIVNGLAAIAAANQ